MFLICQYFPHFFGQVEFYKFLQDNVSLRPPVHHTILQILHALLPDVQKQAHPLLKVSLQPNKSVSLHPSVFLVFVQQSVPIPRADNRP